MDCSMVADKHNDVIAMGCSMVEAEHNSTPTPTPPTQIPSSTTRTEQSLHVMQLRGENPFKCTQCDKKFSQKVGL